MPPAGLCWLDGFEYGLASSRRSDTVLQGEMYTNMNASGAGTAISVVTTPIRSGTYAIQLSSGTPLANYCYLERVLASGSTRFGTCSFWFRVSATPSNDVLVGGMGKEGTTFSELAIGSGGQMKLRARTADAFTNMTGVTISANAWYRAEMWADYGASGTVTFQVKARIYDLTGTLVGSEATVNASGTNTATTVDAFVIDCDVASGALSASINTVFDDWLCSTASADYPLSQFGDWAIELVPLSANGTHNLTAGDLDKTDDSGTNWEALANPETNVQALNSYTLLDEIPWTTTDTDWVRQDVIRTTTYAEYRLTDLTGSDPWGVMVGLHIKNAGTGACTIACRIATSGTESTTGNLSTTHAATTRVHKAAFFAAGGGGAAWTLANFNATTVRVGYAADVTNNPHYCAIAVQVARAAGITETPTPGVASSSGASPTVTIQAAPPLSTAPGAGTAPSARASIPAAQATGTGTAPTQTTAAAPPLGGAPGTGSTPTPSTAATLPLSAATAQSFPPTVPSDNAPTPGIGTGTGQAPTPTTTTTPTAAQATGQGVPPSTATTATPTTGQALAVTFAPTPAILITPAQGTATDIGFPPAVADNTPTPGAAAGASTPPTPRMTATSSTGQATGVTSTPIPAVTRALPISTATGTGSQPVALTTAIPQPGLATGTGIDPFDPSSVIPDPHPATIAVTEGNPATVRAMPRATTTESGRIKIREA